MIQDEEMLEHRMESGCLQLLGYLGRILLGLFAVWGSVIASSDLIPFAYAWPWNYPWEFDSGLASIPLLVGPLPASEVSLAILGTLLIVRIKPVTMLMTDSSLLTCGILLLLGRPYSLWVEHGILLDPSRWNSSENGATAFCSPAGCPPLNLALLLQYIPSLVLAMAMIIVAVFYSRNRPWWKRVIAVLAPYLGSILLLWPIWETQVWPLIGPR